MLILNCIIFMCKGGDGKVCFSHQLYKQHLSAAQMSSRQVSSLNLSSQEGSRGTILSPARTPEQCFCPTALPHLFLQCLGQDCSSVSQAVSLLSHGSDLDSCAETMAKH